MKGRPEIIAVRWLSLQEAMDGADGAKIYKSQESIIQEANAILVTRNDQMISGEEGDQDDGSHKGGVGQKSGCQSVES